MHTLKLKTLLSYHNIPQSDLARGTRISASALSQILNSDFWPKRIKRVDLEQRIVTWLQNFGVDGMQLVGIFERDPPINEVVAAPLKRRHTPRLACLHHEDCVLNPNHQEFDMLLRKQTLTTEAKQAFRFARDPFSDPRDSKELFVSPEIRYVRENLYQVTRYGTFLAIVGESGSGKSTIRKDLHARLAAEQKPVIMIEPYVLGMEDCDKKGRTLKSSHICEAIMACVSPGVTVPQSSERRFRAVHNALRESQRMGNRHVLIVEEAHAIPIPTLKHLKRFFELEDGFEKLLSIVLIGQPELGMKLSESRADVREVVQRCEVVRLNPLGDQLAAYLKHRFAMANTSLDDVMDEPAIEALRGRLTGHSPKATGTFSVLYPLAVHNVLTAALNLAASLGSARLTAEIVEEV
jgi:type II secretory pathway predicted ATPase ExeA